MSTDMAGRSIFTYVPLNVCEDTFLFRLTQLAQILFIAL